MKDHETDLYDDLNAGRAKYEAQQDLYNREDEALKEGNKSLSPFVYTTSILETNERHIDFRGYVPHVVNKYLSFASPTVMLANEMNRCALPPEVQFEFLRANVRKFQGNRITWMKSKKDDTIELIMRVYKYSHNKAKEVADLFTDEQIKQLKKSLNEGGQTKRRKVKK